MADNQPVLTTSRYVEPGTYVGEIINPESSNLSADARIPAIIAKGSRLSVAQNVQVLRSFISAEGLHFSTSPPYIAPLLHVARGDQDLPTRLYKQDGTMLQSNEWAYVSNVGQLNQVQIRDESFDPIATYLFDYQSIDRAVKDPIPVADIRQIRLLGNQVDRAQYKEYMDFYVPMLFTDVIPDVSNVHTEGFFSAITATLQVGSTGSALIDVAADYTHAYTRNYLLTCLAVSGSPGSRQATFKWQAANGSGGNAAIPPTPVASSDSFPTFLLDETVPSSLAVTLELGVIVDLDFGLTHFVAGDLFAFAANGPALVEIDSRYDSPQFATVNDPVVVTGSTVNDLRLAISAQTNYTNARNNKYRLKLLMVSGSSPSRVMQFCWARYGDVIPQSASGTFAIQENVPSSLTQTLSDSVKIDFLVGVASPVVGAQWDVSAQAPRLYYTAKDSRHYKLSLSGVSTVSTLTTISGGFSTDTTEGRFGTFTAKFDTASASAGDGYALLPDNISVAFRNAKASPQNLDIFTFGVLDTQVIDWSLQQVAVDVRQLTDLQTDNNGNITGTAGLKYIILQNVPTDLDSIRVQDYTTGDDISFNWNVGTPYIFFSVAPSDPVKATYKFAGIEPDPGQTYFLTCTFLRPDEVYNAPFLVLRLQDGRNFAAPSAVDNDLYIGNEILWNNGGVGAYLVQPKNVDGSGVYSKPDYVNAILSMRSYDRITDVCLLNYPSTLDTVLAENILACDPFQKRPNLVWVGMAIGTPIGDVNTDGSLVFMAKQTLQTPGASSAKGTRILVAPTRATMTVVLDSGLSTSVTLDGSFVALAGAARIASFNDPATDILRTAINGFDTIQTYRKDEITLLGQAQILYAKGAPGSYIWGEDTTVDTTKNFERIQLMTQRQFVTQVVNREMESLIGITPVSASAAKQLISGQLSSILKGLLARGLIGTYQDADGNDRAFDPTKDVVVFQDKNDLSLFYFNYAWFSRNVIKRLFGLYALNNNDFSTGVALT